MPLAKKIILAILLALVVAGGLWLQLESQDEQPVTVVAESRHDPDYYIENFIRTGMDAQGNPSYVLRAERLIHYPDDDTALLDKPHLTQFKPGEGPTDTYADAGWVSPGGEEVLLTGNVRIVQSAKGSAPGSTTTSDKLRVRLKKGTGKKDS